VSHKSNPDTDNGIQQGELGLRGRLAFTVAWCSFLSASIATLVFFAFVDPAPIVAVLQPTGALPGRTALYSLGFLDGERGLCRFDCKPALHTATCP
jgi:hypothetical protein